MFVDEALKQVSTSFVAFVLELLRLLPLLDPFELPCEPVDPLGVDDDGHVDVMVKFMTEPSGQVKLVLIPGAGDIEGAGVGSGAGLGAIVVGCGFTGAIGMVGD
jgi:hypothetical protein